MERGKYLTDEDKRLIIALHKAGRSEKMIAHGFNRSVSCISRVLKNADAVEQRIKKKEAIRKNPLTKKQEERACELAQQGKGDKAIAYELHVSLQAVHEFMEMSRKDTKSYKQQSKTKKGVSLIPCPFTSCGNRAECKEIEEPQQCAVWQIYDSMSASRGMIGRLKMRLENLKTRKDVKMTNKNTNQIKGETPNFYPKLLDKDGNLINIGDVLYGEDGKAWKVDNILYSAEMSHPVGVWGVREDGTPNYEYQAFTPKWLSRKNPKPEPFNLDTDTLDEWMADLQDKMRKVTESETGEDEREDFI